MELELRQEYISCWDNGYRTCINQEETTEMIVPDACPDILQILDGEGKLLLQRREALDGRAEFSGCIKVGILYQPEGGKSLCNMEGVLPFTTSIEAQAINRHSKLMVSPKIQKVDVHLLNPRKVLIKVNFILDVRCYTPQSLAFCPCAKQEEQHALCQKVEEHATYLPIALQEKNFNYADVLTLPAGRPDMAEILRHRADCLTKEAKVIGNKLLFKGEAKVEVLYRATDDSLCTVVFPLPFSQMMEIGDAGEESVPELQIIYTDLSCKRTDEEGRTLSVELELLAQCVLSRTEQLTLLTDLYSTRYDTQATRKPYTCGRMMDQGVAPENVRDMLESTTPIENILDVQIRPVSLQTRVEEESLFMEAEVDVFVLFQAEQEEIGSLHRRLSVPHSIPTAHNWEYQCDFAVSRDGLATPTSGGVEVNFALDFRWMAMQQDSVEGIEFASAEERSASDEEMPSVIIRSVRGGESLWDIAKAYSSTETDIAEANALPTNELYIGQMLLIPR